MNKIFDKSIDVHVRARIIYVNGSDEYAYADAEKTKKIKATDLKDIFEKGAIIVDGVIEYKPISFNIDSGVGKLTYIKTDDSVATTAVLATLVSSEYMAD